MQINARSANNGLTVDMSQMRGVVVDPVQQTAVVQGPAPLLLPCSGPALLPSSRAYPPSSPKPTSLCGPLLG